MIVAISILASWFSCGLIAGLAFYRYFQSEYPSNASKYRRQDRKDALMWFMGGPISLIATFCVKGFKHGINPFRKP